MAFFTSPVKPSTTFQRLANIISHVLALISLALTFWWVCGNGVRPNNPTKKRVQLIPNEPPSPNFFIFALVGNCCCKDGFLGGYSWANVDERFNLHPIFMVSGMVFVFAEALLSWRTLPFPHRITKV